MLFHVAIRYLRYLFEEYVKRQDERVLEYDVELAETLSNSLMVMMSEYCEPSIMDEVYAMMRMYCDRGEYDDEFCEWLKRILFD